MEARCLGGRSGFSCHSAALPPGLTPQKGPLGLGSPSVWGLLLPELGPSDGSPVHSIYTPPRPRSWPRRSLQAPSQGWGDSGLLPSPLIPSWGEVPLAEQVLGPAPVLAAGVVGGLLGPVLQHPWWGEPQSPPEGPAGTQAEEPGARDLLAPKCENRRAAEDHSSLGQCLPT